MICVSIGRSRHKMMAAEHRHLAEKGAELVELRVDWLNRKVDLGRLLRDRPTPVVLTCRRAEDQGRWRGTEDQRLALLREAIVTGVEYVDLELDIARSIPRYGDTKRVVSYHNFDETPLHLPDICEQLSKCDPDIIKLVTMARTPADNVRVLEMIERSEVPMVAFCMGELGVVSRILCGRMGAPFTYASFSKERQLAPGQLSYSELRNLYAFKRINKETRLFGVLGDPVAHSHSPLIHNAAFRHERINAVYVPLHVPEDSLHETLEEFQKLGFDGYSVTIPHKQDALGAAVPDEMARDVGAANTLYQEEGVWRATNTDYSAALESLLECVQQQHDDPNRTLQGRKVVMLGAGGVARAVGLALVRAGAALIIANRDRDRGSALAEELSCQHVNWENRGAEHAEVVVNCTSVGMHPNVDETPFEPQWLRESAIVMDTVYTPENTLFVKQAKERGCPVVTGVEMFVRQAAAQFKIFTGTEPPLDYMRETLRHGISAARR